MPARRMQLATPPSLLPAQGLGEAGSTGTAKLPSLCYGRGAHRFAPRSPLEIELLRFLLARFSRVSYERVLSGPGLVNIYQFLRETGRGEEPAWLAEELRVHDTRLRSSPRRRLPERSRFVCRRSTSLFLFMARRRAISL